MKMTTAVGCDGQEGHMHIEPGLVDGAKIALGYATAAAAGGTALYHVAKALAKAGHRLGCRPRR